MGFGRVVVIGISGLVLFKACGMIKDYQSRSAEKIAQERQRAIESSNRLPGAPGFAAAQAGGPVESPSGRISEDDLRTAVDAWNSKLPMKTGPSTEWTRASLDGGLVTWHYRFTTEGAASIDAETIADIRSNTTRLACQRMRLIAKGASLRVVWTDRYGVTLTDFVIQRRNC